MAEHQHQWIIDGPYHSRFVQREYDRRCSVCGWRDRKRRIEVGPQHSEPWWTADYESVL